MFVSEDLHRMWIFIWLCTIRASLQTQETLSDIFAREEHWTPQINCDCLLMTSSWISTGLNSHQIYFMSSLHHWQRHGDESYKTFYMCHSQSVSTLRPCSDRHKHWVEKLLPSRSTAASLQQVPDADLNLSQTFSAINATTLPQKCQDERWNCCHCVKYWHVVL